jgi:hypothetical protein
MYRAKRWAVAAERFAAYRDAYRSGDRMDGALYFGGLALSATGKIDAGILLWERLPGGHQEQPLPLSGVLRGGRGVPGEEGLGGGVPGLHFGDSRIR